MTALRDLLQINPASQWQKSARSIMVLIALLLIWASFAPLDEVAVAEGQVVPEGRVKTIQHLEGGVVRDIHVHEGDVVKEGAPLLSLDLAAGGINKEELQVRLDGLQLTKARLLAEITGSAAITFPAAEAKRQPTLVEAERRKLISRQNETASKLLVLSEQERQRALEVQELQAKLRATNGSLTLAREKLGMSGDLLKEGLTAKMDHVALQTEVSNLDGQAATLRASVPRAEAALQEARERINQEKLSLQASLQNELAETELTIARTTELMTQATDQHMRAQITSPIEGIVKNLRNNTIGGVVKGGEVIMEIVPLNEKLLVEAKVNPSDRGYVRVGQEALVKVTAYDYTRYGGLHGKVTMVAADSTMSPDNKPYFRVLVETDRAYLGNTEGLLPITPGMQAQVDVQTGTRSVLQYLLKPIVKIKSEAFRER